MPAYDTFGGGSGANAGSYTYTHTLGALSNGAVLAGFAVDVPTDTGFSVTATFGGTAMTPLALVHCNATTNGFLRVFGLATGSSTGAQTVTGTVSGGTPDDMSGGSLSFSGVNQGSPFGTPATGAGSGTTPTATLSSNTNGNLIAGFCANGQSITSATSPSTSRFIDNFKPTGIDAAGNCAGATSPSTGSPVTMAWLAVNDFWAAILVEVLGSSVNAGLATGTGAALNATTIPASSFSGPNYPALAADLHSGSGLWQNPFLAEGPP